MTDTDRYREILHVAGLRATVPRLAVLAALEATRVPLTVAGIAAAVPDAPDTVTLYRMMDTFVAKNLAHRVDLRGGAARYEATVQRSHHHHIVCTSCGHIEDIADCDIDDVVAQVARASVAFDRATDHTFEVFGVCRACSSASARSDA